MNVYEALKSNDNDIRLTNDAENRWLVWDTVLKQWAVYERKYHARNTAILYHGDSCDAAVLVLLKGN